ncbi:MAG: DMT family transporter [Anaerovoracaceae bacterium]
MQHKTEIKGFFFASFAAIVYGLMPLCAKYIYAGGCTPESLVFYRGLLSMPFIYLLMKKNKQVPLDSKKLLSLFVLTFFGTCLTQVFLFGSYNYISTGLSTTIHYSYPIFVFLGTALIFHEKLSKIKILCVILSTVGILCFYTPGGEISLFGVALSFLSGITFAFYIIFLDKSGLKDLPPFQLCFYMALFISISMIPFTLITGTLTYSFNPTTWILLFIFSLFVNLFATMFFQLGVRYIGTQKTSIINTFEPITSILVGVFVFSEVLTTKIIIGIVIILIAVLILSLFDKSKDPA